MHTRVRRVYRASTPPVAGSLGVLLGYPASVPNIVLNGSPHVLKDGATVLDVLEAHGLQSAQVAVELNRDIVPRAEHASRTLAEEDRLEIVTFVGGG